LVIRKLFQYSSPYWEFLGKELIKIVENIGPEKLVAVVSDHASNACVARKILREIPPYFEYPLYSPLS
jgi:hypothetical protein